MKRVPTPEQLAAIAAGQDVELVLGASADVGAADAGASDAGTAEAETQAKVETLAGELAAAQAEAATAKAEAEAAVTAAQAERDAAIAERDTLKATTDSMRSVVLGRVNAMSIALGKETLAADCDAAALMAGYKTLEADFQAKFRTGRQSAASVEDANLETKAQVPNNSAWLEKAKQIPIY